MIRLGVTGTDTGVGKTVIAVALVSMLRRRGLRVAAMKPVETGVRAGVPTDGARLLAAAGGADRSDDVSPVTYAEALAPLVAAGRTGQAVDVFALDVALGRLAAQRDAIIVEGAGGLLAPLTEQVSYATLFAQWRLGLVVVAANRLGAINHVLLTVHAARTAGLQVRGVVVNDGTGTGPDLATATNAAALARMLPGVPVLTWPRLTEVSDDALGAHAERLGLGRLIEPPAASPIHPKSMERAT
jgi:dethiobiotin synthetase